MSSAILLLGVVIVVRTIAAGGGATSVGVAVGVVFVAIGAARLYLATARRRAGVPLVKERRTSKPPLDRRFLGVPWLWAVAHSAIAFSVYYSLGLVADHALLLDPGRCSPSPGLIYVLTTHDLRRGRGDVPRARRLEHARPPRVQRAGQLHRRLGDPDRLRDRDRACRGHHPALPRADLRAGSATAPARWSSRSAPSSVVAIINIVGFTGSRRQGVLVALTSADLLLQFSLIVVGLIVVWDPSALTGVARHLRCPRRSTGIAMALVISMVALAGIEASSDLAPDLAWRREDLRHVLRAGAFVVPFVYVGMSLVALMALPVVNGPDGPETALATTFEEAPVLGVTEAFSPAWLSDVFQWAVVAIAPIVLLFAANVTMLGLSRHVYVLATNRQIPSWLGKLGRPPLDAARGDPDRVGVRDRSRHPGRHRAARWRLRVRSHAGDLDRPRVADPAPVHRARPRAALLGPVRAQDSRGRGSDPGALGLLLTGAGFVSIFVLHGTALLVGGGWMVFGLIAYFVYRRLVQDLPLTKRVSMPEQALAQAGARRRARQRPRPAARLRQARRRQRLDRLPPGRVESARGSEPARGSTSST